MADLSFKPSNVYQKKDIKMKLVGMCSTAMFPYIRYTI